MFAIAWEYLTGRALAKRFDDQTRAEWPPHPDRVFQALVAAWGESGQTSEGKAALEWLERLPPPTLAAPEATHRDVVSAFVPANDIECPLSAKSSFEREIEKTRGLASKKGKDANAAAAKRARELIAGAMNLLPARSGARSERHFPSVLVQTAHCALVWSQNSTEDARTALAALCRNVTHVGHSSSLVRMWVEDQPPAPNYVPAAGAHAVSLRVPGPGRLGRLIEAYANGGPEWKRPPWARQQGYARVQSRQREHAQGVFGDDWIVLRYDKGAAFGLTQGPAVAEALRKTLIKAADDCAEAKMLISGHMPEGKYMETPHVAFVPLGDVGHEYADGHLMGVALAMPRSLTYEQRDACLQALVAAGNSEGRIRLVFGPAGDLTLKSEEREVPPRALRPESWCQTAIRWASATPIALDRLPPRARGNHDAWAAEQIGLACERIGLPRPDSVRILPVSRFSGAPTCREFPPLTRRTDGGPRWHVHADMVFAEPIHGPVLLGAGRYRGYGLCKPLLSEREE